MLDSYEFPQGASLSIQGAILALFLQTMKMSCMYNGGLLFTMDLVLDMIFK